MSPYRVLLISIFLILTNPPPLPAAGLSLPILKHQPRHHSKTETSNNNIVITPTNLPNSVVFYYVQVNIGMPPFLTQLALDAATPTTWLQSESCTTCFNTSSKNFDPSKSTTFGFISPSNPTCAPPFASVNGTCGYDFGSTKGLIGTDTFSFLSSQLSIDSFAFGIGTSNNFDFPEGSPILGKLGLSAAHPSSILRQLNVQHFSYCLPTDSGSGASLDFGPTSAGILGEHNGTTTPIIKGPTADHPFEYYLNLTGIRIDGKQIGLPGQGPGFVIDVGSPVTLLTEGIYGPVRAAVESYLWSKYKVRPESETRSGFDLCYDDYELIGVGQNFTLPDMDLGFDGGATLRLPASQIFYRFSNYLETCLLVMPTGGNGPSRLGSMQQAGQRFLFDLRGSTLSFAANSC